MACGLFFREQRPVVAQCVEVEELEPGKQGVECSLGYAQVIADVKDLVLDLPLANLIRRDHVVGGELADSPQILASGSFNESGELHVPGHAVTELGHHDTLSCVGPKNSSPNSWNSKGIRRESSEDRSPPSQRNQPSPLPHPAAKPLRPIGEDGPRSGPSPL